MKRRFISLLCAAALLMSGSFSRAEVPDSIPQVRNIILMIPDGCSLASYSVARWYQRYLNEDQKYLNIDPYLCGTVLTYCSDSPVGDSAPTTSCYMTGYPSQAGYVSTYPVSAGDQDVIPMDPQRAYTPVATLLEMGKIKLGKRTGLVVTCEFPHATPADCSSHSASRKRYDIIVPQMLHQNMNVVMGGGSSLMPKAEKARLEVKGYDVVLDDLQALRKSKKSNLWALFGKQSLPNDMDRDTTKIPSISEMTKIAIDKLDDKNSTGFFLMVEGSKVDWAAHANDPVGIVSELLAFDKACKVALDFAKKDGHTAVVILSDHGNSGISLAKEDGYNHPQNMNKKQFFEGFVRHKKTAEGLSTAINKTPYAQLDSLMMDLSGIKLTSQERDALLNTEDYVFSPITKDQRKLIDGNPFASKTVYDYCCKLLTKHSPVGFTTHGHTGEDVILFAYHPENAVPRGMTINVDLADYLARLWGKRAPYDSLTDEIFSPQNEVFKGMKIIEVPAKKDYKKLAKYDFVKENLQQYAPTLVIKNGKKTMTVEAYVDYVTINGKKKQIPSVTIYEPNTKKFYLPKSLRALML